MKCRNMVTNVLPADTSPTTRGDGLRGQKSTFSEHGHVAYQVKGNHECSNMVANILPADPPPPLDPGGGFNRSTFNFFRTMSCYISN